MNKDKLIVTQVAFKGAVDLVCSDKLELDEIMSFTMRMTEEMMKNAPSEPTYKYGNKPEYTPPKPVSAVYNKPSDKQLKFINSLLKEVPKSEADKLVTEVPKLSGKDASKFIEKLIELKDSQEPKARENTAPDEAAF